MKKYCKKPVVIEAVQWLGQPAEGGIILRLLNWGVPLRQDGSETFEDAIHILTLEGEMLCNLGDWIIKGVKGEFYPCKPDIFEATYEAV